jgi:hypothetical protein
MTSDNLIGIIVGAVVFPTGLVLFIYAEPFTRFVRAVSGRIYGESRRSRQLERPALVRVVAGAWVVLGLLAIVTALLGGFRGQS